MVSVSNAEFKKLQVNRLPLLKYYSLEVLKAFGFAKGFCTAVRVPSSKKSSFVQIHYSHVKD